MTSFRCSDSTKAQRFPFADKTNVVREENVTPSKSDNYMSVKSNQFDSLEVDFKPKPRKTRANLRSQKVAATKIISDGGSKSKGTSKFCAKDVDIESVMPNQRRTRSSNGNVSKSARDISTVVTRKSKEVKITSNVSTGSTKLGKPVQKDVSHLENNISKTDGKNNKNRSQSTGQEGLEQGTKLNGDFKRKKTGKIANNETDLTNNRNTRLKRKQHKVHGQDNRANILNKELNIKTPEATKNTTNETVQASKNARPRRKQQTVREPDDRLNNLNKELNIRTPEATKNTRTRRKQQRVGEEDDKPSTLSSDLQTKEASLPAKNTANENDQVNNKNKRLRSKPLKTHEQDDKLNGNLKLKKVPESENQNRSNLANNKNTTQQKLQEQDEKFDELFRDLKPPNAPTTTKIAVEAYAANNKNTRLQPQRQKAREQNEKLNGDLKLANATTGTGAANKNTSLQPKRQKVPEGGDPFDELTRNLKLPKDAVTPTIGTGRARLQTKQQKAHEQHDPFDELTRQKHAVTPTIGTSSARLQPKQATRYNEQNKNINKDPEISKKVQFLQDPQSSMMFDKALRKRKTKNYAELSFKDSLSPATNNVELENKKHVPVYLQNTQIDKDKQKEADPFEFVPDSPSKRLNKKKHKGKFLKDLGLKDETSDSDVSAYDKSMHEILNKIRRKINLKQSNQIKPTSRVKGKEIPTAKGNARKKNNTKSRTNKTGTVAQNVKGPNTVQIQATAESSKQKIIEVSKKPTKGLIPTAAKLAGPTKRGEADTIKLLTQHIQNISKRNARLSAYSCAIQKKTEECGAYFGFEDDYVDDIEDISTFLPEKQGSTSTPTTLSIKPISALQRFTSLTSTPLPNIHKSSAATKSNQTPDRINIISNILVSPPRHANFSTQWDVSKIATPSQTSGAKSCVESYSSDFLGFDNDSTAQNKNSKATPQSFATSSNNLAGSIANPTMTAETGFRGFANKVKKRQKSRPWRENHLQIRRNPHFLTMKNTSLPCYNQEMILEPKLLERSKSPTIIEEPVDNMVQTSILDYISTDKVNDQSTPTKKNQNMTLFDDFEFSPIKNTSNRKKMSPRKSPENEQLETSRGRRNIFAGEKPKKNISPLRQINREQQLGVENYFGFDSPDQRPVIGKENVRTRVRAKKEAAVNKEALPMRVPIKVLKKIRDEAVEGLLEEVDLDKVAGDPAVEEVAENLSANENSQEEAVPHVGLFEDLIEVKPPPRIYERKRAKRTRVVSVDTEVEEPEKPKRKKKDGLTPAEQQQFNKWADEFNAMCTEVDQHDLTIV